MPKGTRKGYLDPNSNEPIPRSTLHRIQYNLRNQSVLEQTLPTRGTGLNDDEEMDSNFEICTDRINYAMMFEDDQDQYFTSTPNQPVNTHYIDESDSTEDSSDEEKISQPNVPLLPINSGDSYLNKSICKCSSTTAGEAMMMCLALGMRHSLTWVAICDMLKMINTITACSSVPTTKYKLLKHFGVHGASFKYHLYCPDCGKYIGERSQSENNQQIISCPTCSSQFNVHDMSSFFLTLNMHSQLTDLLHDPQIVASLQERFHRQKLNVDALEDIYDGKMYKKFCGAGGILSNKWNLSYTFNTDGCQAANSSKLSIWPIYAMINELPPDQRAKNMLLIGIWVAKTEPNMNVFLEPFVHEANELSNVGVTWKLNKNQTITSKVIPLCCCVDSIARPAILNMKQFNGFYGCTFCEHPTENVNGQRKYTMSASIPPNRSDDSIERAMVLAHTRGDGGDVNGVWGPSCLMNLEHFDLAEGMVPDAMHAVFLGVAKQYTEIILTSVGEEYYVGDPNRLSIIEDRLLTIRPPNCITRTPRNLTERRLWKASEWRSWLIWYSVLCLDGVLPKKYLEHHALLVTAIYIFLQDSISQANLNYASHLLVRYVAQFQEFFQKSAMTFNVHLLLHLSRSVANWGPLWTHNAFPFENENRLLLQLKKGPTHVAVQIARKYTVCKSLSVASRKFLVSEKVKKFCQGLRCFDSGSPTPSRAAGGRQRASSASSIESANYCKVAPGIRNLV